MNLSEYIIINASRVAIALTLSVFLLAIVGVGLHVMETRECKHWHESDQIQQDWQTKQCQHVGVI